MASFNITDPYSNTIIDTISFTSYTDTVTQLQQLSTGLLTQQSLGISQRIKILNTLSHILEANLEDFARLITSEMGKPITESYAEMKRALVTIKSTVVDIQALRGESIDSTTYGIPSNKIGIVQHFPLGIILCITPFNFPINLALHKLAPGFAAGNCLLFKPSPKTYLSAKKLVECCYEAGIPNDCLQLIIPTIHDLEKLVSLPNIQCISLTGSPNTAKSLTKHMGLKKFICELGGNDPFIVMPDSDLDLAAKIAVSQRFGTAGQRCNAPKRFYIHEQIYSNFKDLVMSYTKALRIGDPYLTTTDMGPMCSIEAAHSLEEIVHDHINKGALSLFSIKREGALLYPIILESVPDDSSLITEEVFGPVMVLQSFSTIDSVIESINSSAYGLQAGVFTHDIKLAKSLFTRLQVGALNLNDGPGFRADHFPFTGIKESGIGSEGTRYTIDSMTYRKTLII
tara:strand:+ start:920 stop:2287 length:1368 start_codon:yes stop_codon:yes gene_type:complete